MEYRLLRVTRLGLEVAYRMKQHPDNDERNGVNQYVLAAIEQRFEGDRELELSSRYERNRATNDRYDYRRFTHEAVLSTPIGKRDALELGLKYRTRRYDHRLVEVGDEEVLRQEYRWAPSLQWERALAGSVYLEAAYEFETRSSNDPDKSYDAHQFAITFTRRW